MFWLWKDVVEMTLTSLGKGEGRKRKMRILTLEEDEEIRQAQGVYSREREKVSLHFCYLSYIWSVCPLPN
jgi:hypothetical protein